MLYLQKVPAEASGSPVDQGAEDLDKLSKEFDGLPGINCEEDPAGLQTAESKDPSAQTPGHSGEHPKETLAKMNLPENKVDELMVQVAATVKDNGGGINGQLTKKQLTKKQLPSMETLDRYMDSTGFQEDRAGEIFGSTDTWYQLKDMPKVSRNKSSRKKRYYKSSDVAPIFAVYFDIPKLVVKKLREKKHRKWAKRVADQLMKDNGKVIPGRKTRFKFQMPKELQWVLEEVEKEEREEAATRAEAEARARAQVSVPCVVVILLL